MKTNPAEVVLLSAMLLLVTVLPGVDAAGPLRVSKGNPRYCTDDSGKAIYLSGAHTWNTLQDMGPADPPPAFDFDGYLDFLEKHHHNFIRLWRWELVTWNTAANREKESKIHFAALGDTRRFADKMNLATMTPQNALSSTQYCLADAGHEYLVYQPRVGESFSVELRAGTYQAEWFNPTEGKVEGNHRVESSGGAQAFEAPFKTDAVLYLKAR